LAAPGGFGGSNKDPGFISIWNTSTQQKEATLVSSKFLEFHFAFSPNGIVGASIPGITDRINFWDIRNYVLIKSIIFVPKPYFKNKFAYYSMKHG
jgi:hypothetical protein